MAFVLYAFSEYKSYIKEVQQDTALIRYMETPTIYLPTVYADFDF